MKRIYLTILAMFLFVTVARGAEVEVLKPKGNLEIKLGHPSSISLYDMPAILTRERLNRNGWNVSSVEFTRTDLNVQAWRKERFSSPTRRSWIPCAQLKKAPSSLSLWRTTAASS